MNSECLIQSIEITLPRGRGPRTMVDGPQHEAIRKKYIESRSSAASLYLCRDGRRSVAHRRPADAADVHGVP